MLGRLLLHCDFFFFLIAAVPRKGMSCMAVCLFSNRYKWNRIQHYSQVRMVPFRKTCTREKPGQFFSVSECGNWMSQNTKSRSVNAQVTVVWCPPPLAGLSTPLRLMSALQTKTQFLTGLATFLSLMSPALSIVSPHFYICPATAWQYSWNVSYWHFLNNVDIQSPCGRVTPPGITEYLQSRCTYKLEHVCEHNSTCR